MEALWNEDGDRIIISRVKYFSSLSFKLNSEEREWMIEKMANGRKGMERSTTKTWKTNFVVSVHSRSQGLFTLEGTGVWKMNVQHKDLLPRNEVIVGFYEQRTAKVLPIFRHWPKRKKQSKKLQTCLTKCICVYWLCTHFEGKNDRVYTHKGKQYPMQPKYIKVQTQHSNISLCYFFFPVIFLHFKQRKFRELLNP